MRRNLLLVISATILSLLFAEVVVRFIPPDVSVLRNLVVRSDSPIGYRLKPNVSIEFGGLFESLPKTVRWATNPQGIRSPDVIAEEASKWRVATFGDSETFGWSVEQSETYQARLEALATGVEVINFGVPGYNTTNILLAMREQLPRFRPDVTVYLFNKNDFDVPLAVTDTEFTSQLFGRIRFFWQVSAAREQRQRERKSAQRTQVAVDDLRQMTELAETSQVPLLVVFMRRKELERMKPSILGDATMLQALDSGVLTLVDGEPALGGTQRLDDHLGPRAHELLARQLCDLPRICVSGASSPAVAAAGDADSRTLLRD